MEGRELFEGILLPPCPVFPLDETLQARLTATVHDTYLYLHVHAYTIRSSYPVLMLLLIVTYYCD